MTKLQKLTELLKLTNPGPRTTCSVVHSSTSPRLIRSSTSPTSGPFPQPQLNFAIDDRFQAVAEFRFNEYEDANPLLDGAGLALGVAVAF